jgi:hypothetical protein
VDAAGWSIVIAVILGFPTLWFAYRATRVSEQTLLLERRRADAEKRARLEFAEPRGRGKIWSSVGRTAHQTAWFETEVRNRGPAHALDLQWSAIVGTNEVEVGHAPDRLYVMDEEQVIVAIPLDSDLAPIPQVIRIKVVLTDDEGRKSFQWCLRFAGDRHHGPEEWTLEDLDCISLKPRNARWAQPSRDQ